MTIIAVAILYILRAYMLLIFVWALGSWFPQWQGQGWFRLVDDIVKPYISLFRALPLRTGTVDFTPMAAILALYVFEWLVAAALAGGLR